MNVTDARKKKIQVFAASKHTKKATAMFQDLTNAPKSSPKPSVNTRFSSAMKAKLSP